VQVTSVAIGRGYSSIAGFGHEGDRECARRMATRFTSQLLWQQRLSLKAVALLMIIKTEQLQEIAGKPDEH
jgi:hypothetical protein